jgi:hypothetical protein
MNINISYGIGDYCTLTFEQEDLFLNGEENQVRCGLNFLDPAIELISNTKNEKIEDALELIEVARNIIEDQLKEAGK